MGEFVVAMEHFIRFVCFMIMVPECLQEVICNLSISVDLQYFLVSIEDVSCLVFYGNGKDGLETFDLLYVCFAVALFCQAVIRVGILHASYIEKAAV